MFDNQARIGAMNCIQTVRSREASWTAATESAESPLSVGVAMSAARLGHWSAATAKAVTSQTPSPQSKTWRQFRRLMGSFHDFKTAHWGHEPRHWSAGLRHGAFRIARGSMPCRRPALQFMARDDHEQRL